MTLTDSQRAGAAATVVAVLTALGAGYLYTRAPQPGDVLVRSTVLVEDPALPALGVQIVDGGTADVSTTLGWRTIALDGGGTADGGSFVAILAHGGLPLTGSSYWRVAVCAPVVDGGHDPGQSFLGPQVTVVYDDDSVGTCPDGGPVIEAWEQGRSDAPFPCACSTVERTGLTLQPGAWAQDGGYLPKTCVEIAGVDSMPEACRP